MLGRKTFTHDEVDHCKRAMDDQLAAYRALVDALRDDDTGAATLAAFEPLFFNNLTLALDRYFVHRVRMVTGKDQTPLNELEMIADSLMNNDGVLHPGSVIRHDPARSVLKLKAGDPIRIGADDFALLLAGCLAEIEAKFR